MIDHVSLAVVEGNNTRNATPRELVDKKFKMASIEFTINGQVVEIILDCRTNEIIVKE